MGLLWDGVREGCGSCEFALKVREPPEWYSEKQKVDWPTLVCRRYPPTVKPSKTGGPPTMVHPEVAVADWCGEWKRKDQYEA